MTEKLSESQLTQMSGAGPAFVRSCIRYMLGKRDTYTGDDLKRLMAAHQARRAGVPWKVIRQLYPARQVATDYGNGRDDLIPTE